MSLTILSTIVVLVTIIYLFFDKRYRWFYIIYKTFPRDIRAGLKFLKLNYTLWIYERNGLTVPKLFTQLANKQPDKVAFYFESDTWTFKDVEKHSNKVANFFRRQHFRRGETIALLLESRPAYVSIWLGLAKCGLVTALINSNLTSDSLVHSLHVSDARAIIYGSDFAQTIKDIASKIPKLKLYNFSTSSISKLLDLYSVDLGVELEKSSTNSPIQDILLGKPRDKLIYIYTSGTTGLPKAAVINNMRYMFMSMGINYMASLRSEDILYNSLPLYHSAGGVIGIGQCLVLGLTVVIRKRFSATNFWLDCIKYKCTAAQYIGEICRYLLNVHQHDSTNIDHLVRVMFGNGLRPQIWQDFIKKFHVKQICEFYGATEGTSNLINTDNQVGAVGFVPRYARYIYPVTLIRCNETTGEAIRKDGFCIRCKPEEAGVFVGVINPRKAVNDFAGYADRQATEKKLIRDVFRKGDLYFNSGDILVQDEFGYYYFKDRTGDTFRWKGENVSTSEVEAVISNLIDYRDAVSYGVQIPGLEGRAGMVAIVDSSNDLDLDKFAKDLKDTLPSYSIPIFLRLMKKTPVTSTFKLKKIDLQNEGFDIKRISDCLYFYDSKRANYIQLTQTVYDEIISGQIRL